MPLCLLLAVGAPYGKPFVTWDRGEYVCASNQQRDYDLMTRPLFLTYTPGDGIGNSLPTALALCASGTSSCSSPAGDPGATVATAQGMVSTGRNGGTDRKVFQLTAQAGPLSVTVQAVPSVLAPYDVNPWMLSNLMWRVELLNAAGNVVAGPVRSDFASASSTLSTTVAAGSYFVRIEPVTVNGQAGTYGMSGSFALSASFRNQVAVTCPTNGLPECVDATSGKWHQQQSLSLMNSLQLCATVH